MVAQLQQHVIALPHDFSLPSLADLQLQVNNEWKEGVSIQLDAEAVERLDGAALQFVIAFAKSDIASQPAICHESELLLAAFEDIGTDPTTMCTLFDQELASTRVSE